MLRIGVAQRSLPLNTTDSGEETSPASQPSQSNTEPEPDTDLRITLRNALLETVYPREPAR